MQDACPQAHCDLLQQVPAPEVGYVQARDGQCAHSLGKPSASKMWPTLLAARKMVWSKGEFAILLPHACLSLNFIMPGAPKGREWCNFVHRTELASHSSYSRCAHPG